MSETTERPEHWPSWLPTPREMENEVARDICKALARVPANRRAAVLDEVRNGKF